MNYVILNADVPSKLETQVMRYLNMGYICQGGLCYDKVFGFSQAMIKP